MWITFCCTYILQSEMEKKQTWLYSSDSLSLHSWIPSYSCLKTIVLTSDIFNKMSYVIIKNSSEFGCVLNKPATVWLININEQNKNLWQGWLME